MQDETDAYVQVTIQTLPATENRLVEIKRRQKEDEVCKQIVKYCQKGWPSIKSIPQALKKFYPVAAELSVQNGLLLRGSRLVIPVSMQTDILQKLHVGHQGIRKCRERAKQAVWWPGISKQLERLVRECPNCIKFRVQRAEPLIPSPLPSLPWQKVGTDLFEWDKNTYLLIIDYYSRWIEIAKLTGLTANSVINHTKSIFARYGIPETVVSDNGPQFSSDAYTQFAREYGFKHSTSSPNHPQGNGEAERGVQTIENLLKKGGDPYLALLAYRSTPLEIGYSPSELLMSRRLSTTVPMTESQRKPKTPDFSKVAARDKQLKQRQMVNHDAHHGARELPVLSVTLKQK